MCFEKPPLSWILETHVASACLLGGYIRAPHPAPQNLCHGLASSAMVFNYDQRR